MTYPVAHEDEIAEPPAIPWPERPSAPAFEGLAGDITRIIEPHSEADPAAVLCQVLVMFGNMTGRSAHFVTDGAKQHLNENLLINGPTSSGRKGTGMSQVRPFFALADPQWVQGQIRSGLSSGEGLIQAVRDPDGLEIGTADPGTRDKRLLVMEPEFASVLKVIRREGNTLSPLIRQSWDSGSLRTMTRTAPLSATDAHISIIGHITPNELQGLLRQVDASNGLINRFLIIASRRSKYRPDGGTPSDVEIREAASVLRVALTFAQQRGRMERDTAARELWHEVYPQLVDRPAGLLGSLTSRAAPHVVRLSCIYALLDGRPDVGRRHLESALALWDYVERSVAFFFGDSLGDPMADAILAFLRTAPEGITLSEIHKHSSGHWSAEEIRAALTKLAREGLANVVKQPTKGRPKEVWTLSTGLYPHTSLNTRADSEGWEEELAE